MPNRRKSNIGRKSTPKIFKCTKYGDCNMVFTRSEHLLRHERKHTGEKPYKCIEPGCDRRFSRFDNMMQHTRTHEKGRMKCSTYLHHAKRTTRSKKNIAPNRTLPLPDTGVKGHCYSWPSLQYDDSSGLTAQHFNVEYGHRRRSFSSTSTSSIESSPTISSNNEYYSSSNTVRRLSIQDLCLPIEEFNHSLHLENKDNIVYITSDEFEALEAFSKFRTTITTNSNPTLGYSESADFASQLCAMRQRVMGLNESYQRA